MANVNKYKLQSGEPVKTSGSFVRLVALAMLGSFGAGAAGSYFTDNNSAIAGITAGVTKYMSAYSRCTGSIRYHCVVDGDTLWSYGIKIRLADIDTPEVTEPRCAAEKALGDRATVRLIELVNAGPFETRAWPGRDEDRYGRKLRVLLRNGRSLGDMLVAEGLARTWTGRRQPWC
ncbi:thermonuclease family protein [Phyllobacterium pellucidum]|uniref:thermonuclease family protein n=1 Tax=Phyllobacterium pellucidum TaxID=2740464 RepID=UPI001D1573E5|nr:thermonuclease family protein [Phyllobacterium sp. T1018]UGY08317.1 thermonuclease family protein [Phyllobacterium sp. T1018]